MLMCGHPDHDERFAELCAESDRTLAVLWPSDTSLSMGELKEIADRDTGGRITLIAVDATWNGARQVIRNHPPHLHRVQLDAEQIFPPGQERSMMAPLRSYSAADESYSNRCAVCFHYQCWALPCCALTRSPALADTGRCLSAVWRYR